MVRLLFRIAACFILPFLSADVLAQAGRPPMAGASTTGEKVELLPGSDSLVGVNIPGQVVRKIYNNVRFRQKGVLMYCNLAIQNVTTNVIEAYGNVRLVQGDTINVRGDTMYYYGNTRQANLRGHVVMRDRKCSTSYLQRRLQIGYNRAASLVERMEDEGIISPPNHAGKRPERD